MGRKLYFVIAISWLTCNLQELDSAEYTNCTFFFYLGRRCFNCYNFFMKKSQIFSIYFGGQIFFSLLNFLKITMNSIKYQNEKVNRRCDQNNRP